MGRTIAEILACVATLPGCSIEPATELDPDIFETREGVQLPSGLGEFYRRCNGISLFTDREYPLFIHRFDELQRANPLIVGHPCEEDRSYHWFVIANDGNGDYISIDLSPERLGRCYDSHFTSHAARGQCPVVAVSFTDLLERAVANHGDYFWWLKDSFESLGDAYDG